MAYFTVNFVYKIIVGDLPDPVPDEFPLDDADKRDGFVHLSWDNQLPSTSKIFFDQHDKITVLRLDYPALKDKIDANSGFPHLDGVIKKEHLVSTQKYEKQPGESWLVYVRSPMWTDALEK